MNPHNKTEENKTGDIAGAELILENISKKYGDVCAARDVSLTIKPGEFLTLLGPSGSGKTTILMTIAGFVEPSAGRLFLNGQPLEKLPPYKRNIGMVFQDYALFPHMSVGENVAFPLRMRKFPKNEIGTRVSEILALVGLPEHQTRRIDQLSGGQQQRVALARALVYNPPLLLMDEPLGALDLKLREQLQLEVKHIQKRSNITVVYVTHDQGEALVMSDRMGVMNNGNIVQVGGPRELYENPGSSFVANFLGESNLLESQIVDLNGEQAVSQLLNSEIKVRGFLRGEFSAGDQVLTMIRPEKLCLVEAGKESSYDNICRGVLDELIFFGDSVKYIVKLNNEARLILKTTNTESARWLSPGQEVKIGWESRSTFFLT